MPQIKHIESGQIYDVSVEPQFVAGVWECGDQRFTDMAGNEFSIVPLQQKPPSVSAIQFKLLWTSAERINIKELRKTDPVIDDFMSIVDDPRVELIVLSLDSVQNAIQYTLGALHQKGVFSEEQIAVRLTEILAGQTK